ncbi:uncharacterized protein LOC127854823 [Dreissena polymorpha]|uniref:Homeobox domain-containing protein n=1 Tax=Dreissena polymorpha TaxID=45954 RepID=A0A9D4HL33_DREPO|nr:uncharacterized protein LOC127854823 [Dreissena polymorpha]KAH3720501.1 hypothetical protein DPMN_063400 [Dreissena polymorpha]
MEYRSMQESISRREITENDAMMESKNSMIHVVSMIEYLNKKMKLEQYTEVMDILKSIRNMKDPELVKLWDEAIVQIHLRRNNLPMSPINKFRVRQRHPPPPGICEDGRGRQTRMLRSSRRVLAAWYQRHALNPYPSGTEKRKLALEAGLTLKQVSMWFTNKRRRRRLQDFREDEIGSASCSVGQGHSCAESSCHVVTSTELDENNNCARYGTSNISSMVGNCSEWVTRGENTGSCIKSYLKSFLEKRMQIDEQQTCSTTQYCPLDQEEQGNKFREEFNPCTEISSSTSNIQFSIFDERITAVAKRLSSYCDETINLSLKESRSISMTTHDQEFAMGTGSDEQYHWSNAANNSALYDTALSTRFYGDCYHGSNNNNGDNEDVEIAQFSQSAQAREDLHGNNYNHLTMSQEVHHGNMD